MEFDQQDTVLREQRRVTVPPTGAEVLHASDSGAPAGDPVRLTRLLRRSTNRPPSFLQITSLPLMLEYTLKTCSFFKLVRS